MPTLLIVVRLCLLKEGRKKWWKGIGLMVVDRRENNRRNGENNPVNMVFNQSTQ